MNYRLDLGLDWHEETSDHWVSAETEDKEHDFRGILGMHVQICKSILGKYGGPPYLYVDLHAGPGELAYNGREFLGSPLIFLDLAERAEIDYEALFFEQDQAVAARLAEAVFLPRSIMYAPIDSDVATVHAVPCQNGMARWLAAAGQQPRRRGLVYADPIGKEIPHALLAKVAAALPKVDILSYVSATAYKRRGSARLTDHIDAVGKGYALVREPHGRQQWTFLLFTNWGKFPEWANRGFYRVDSGRGAQILNELNLTRRELRAVTNVPLPFTGEVDG